MASQIDQCDFFQKRRERSRTKFYSKSSDHVFARQDGQSPAHALILKIRHELVFVQRTSDQKLDPAGDKMKGQEPRSLIAAI